MEVNLLAFEKIGHTTQDDESTENFNNQGIDIEFLYPRSGHRIAADEGNIYALGGYNPRFWNVENVDESTYYPLFKELWKFNTSTRKWSLLSTDGHMPIELASHAAVLYGRNLLCFGGTGVPFGQSSSNQLHICNLDTLKWRHFSTTGDLPQKKYGHSICVVGQFLYVCGGTSGFVYNIDIHQLNLKTAEWKLLAPAEKKYVPEPRYRHEIIWHENKLYLFGGGTAETAFGFEKVPVFDLERLFWEQKCTLPDKKHGFPKNRKCHSCVFFENSAFICGGFDSSVIMDDIWKLCFTTMQWTKLSASLLVPVYFHSADVTKEGCMYVFGGVSKIDYIRTNCIQRIWLKVPSLQELCWNYLSKNVHFERLQDKVDNLLEIGIPIHLIDRIS